MQPWWKSCLVATGTFLLGSTLGMALLNGFIEEWTRRDTARGGNNGPGIGTTGILLAIPAFVVGGLLGVALAALLRRYGLAAAVPYVAAAGWALFVIGVVRLMG